MPQACQVDLCSHGEAGYTAMQEDLSCANEVCIRSLHALCPPGMDVTSSTSEQIIFLRHSSLFARQMQPAEHVHEVGLGNDVVQCGAADCRCRV